MNSPLHSEHMPPNNWWEYNYFIYNDVIFQNHNCIRKTDHLELSNVD